MRRVVISGCGLITPVGLDKKATWNNLLDGNSGISRITQFDASGYDSQIAGEISEFDPSLYFAKKDIRRTSRFVQLVVAAACEALQESGLDLETIDPYKIGVLIGSGIGSLQTVEREASILAAKGPQRISPFLIPMLITNEAAGIVAIKFGLKGVNYAPVTACASGAHAIGEGFLQIQTGRADVMVCGGTESSITPLGVSGFCALKALSRRNDDPKQASRPFDRNRDGFVMSEGAGIVVLEEYEHARKRGAVIYGELAGYGATCDAYHITAPDPEGKAPAQAMTQALQAAGVTLTGNVYVNAHGTSTPLNDKMETNAIKRAYGDFARKLHISSTKSVMGHTLGAAGAIEFIVCCLALKNKVIPPTINYKTPDPECDLDYTPNTPCELALDFAVSNSLGFGGHNAVLLVKGIS